MELLVTLRHIESLEKILPFADGVILGSHFTNGYHLSLEEITQSVRFCRTFHKKVYIIMDDFISEDEKMLPHLSLLTNPHDFIDPRVFFCLRMLYLLRQKRISFLTNLSCLLLSFIYLNNLNLFHVLWYNRGG